MMPDTYCASCKAPRSPETVSAFKIAAAKKNMACLVVCPACGEIEFWSKSTECWLILTAKQMLELPFDVLLPVTNHWHDLAADRQKMLKASQDDDSLSA